MFWLLMGLLHVGVRGAAVGKNIRDEYEDKRRAVQEKRDWYLDRNGQTRRLCDDQLTITVYDSNGDHIKKNPVTGQIYRNLDLEKRREYDRSKESEKRSAIKSGKHIYLYDKNLFSLPHYPYQIKKMDIPKNTKGDQEICGHIWKDTNNERLYVKRYIRTYNGHVSDEDLKNNMHNNFFEAAIVLMDLYNGRIMPEIIGWNSTTNYDPSEWSKQMIYKEIEKLNKRDNTGEFVNRKNDPWLNVNKLSYGDEGK